MTVRFSKEHEWVRIEGDVGVVGITNYAQQQLGDVVFVELPAIGTHVHQGKEAAVVESVKAASDVYSPLSGNVTEVNKTLGTDPAVVNRDPLGQGWFMKIRFTNRTELDNLMDEAAYKAFVSG